MTDQEHQPRNEPATQEKPSGHGKDFAIVILSVLLLGVVVFLVSQPEEVTSPPRPEQSNAGDPNAPLPADHPPVSNEVPQEARDELAALTSSVEQNPEDMEARLELANLLYDLGQHFDPHYFEDALPHYQIYLQANPENPDARTDMAYVLYKSGDISQAITELRRVRASHPDHQNSAFNLGFMFVQQNEPDSVLKYMRKVVEIDSTTRVGRAAAAALAAQPQS